MAGKLITVFGGSGFLGRHVVRRLAADGWRVRVAVRDTRKAQFLKPGGDLGQISFAPASIRDPASVAAALVGADAAINLVGILYERGSRSFQAVHVDGAAIVAKAVAAAGIKRFVHVSALGAAADSPSTYARSKAAGELAVQAAFPAAAIFRPSVIFGPEDGFFNLFGFIAQVSPILPFFTNIVPHAQGGGGPSFQPVYVGDVAEAIVQAIDNPARGGKVYELGGPRVYDMRAIMNIVNDATGRHRWVCGLPFALATIKATVLQFLPKPLLTPDQVKLMKLGSVVAGRLPGLEAFGIAPTTVEVVVPTYLKRFRAVQQNKRLRFQAGN